MGVSDIMTLEPLENDLFPKILFFLAVAFVIFWLGENFGELLGKRDASKWHCQSQGFEEFHVTDRGTIECIKVTRETIR